MEQFNLEKFNPSQNMFIEASAGTGKTYTIQQIVAKLLEANKSDPEFNLEKIVVLTFTDKAAGELKDRIRSKLEELNLQDQLALVDNAPISTFHSFCQRITEEFPIAANLCTNLKLVGKDKLNSYAEKFIRDYLPKAGSGYYKDALLVTNNEIADTVKAALIKLNGLYYLDKNGQEVKDFVVAEKGTYTASWIEDLRTRFSDEEKFLFGFEDELTENNFEILVSFYEKLNDPESSVDVSRKIFHPKMDALISGIKEKLEILQRNPAILKKADLIERVNKNLALFNESPFKLFTNLVYAGKGEKKFGLVKDIYNLCPELKNLDDEFKKLREKIQELQEKLASEYKNYLVENFLSDFYKGFLEEENLNKEQTYDDMIRNIREAVCSPEWELKEKLKAKYKYAIIDEFQDTNQKQWDIFSHIFMEDGDHSIFVVGDPKQSIFAFQGADIQVYKKAIGEILSGNENKGVAAGQAFSLDTNWRSTKPMINSCNALFRGGFFSQESGIGFADSQSPANQRPEAEYDGNPCKPVWAPMKKINEENKDKPMSLEEYAWYIAERIIDFCKIDEKGNTKLQIYKKQPDSTYRKCNLQLSDIAVLCRSKNQIATFKDVFEEIGLPATHYKETCLFMGKEALEWISILSAVDAGDFTGSNRKILGEALFTEFFAVPMEQIQNQKYDRPDCQERMTILKWNQLAQKRQWAALREKIFEDTRIEARLCSFNQLRHLSILRQIADYWVNYLYENNCSLREAIENLTALSAAPDTGDTEDDNYVAKGSDFNVVQMMTIHASKGLQFPVVVTCIGKMNRNYSCIYHSPDGVQHLCFNGDFHVSKEVTASEIGKKECGDENDRLMYVNYTRAESLMFMPLNLSQSVFNNKFTGSDLKTRQTEYIDESTEYAELENIDEEYKNLLREKVAELIKNQNPEKESADKSTLEKQEEAVKQVKNQSGKMNAYKLSYSNLTHGKNEKIQKEENLELEEEDLNYEKTDLSAFDKTAVHIPCEYAENPESLTKIIEGYPKGTALGEAVHQVFEKALFNKMGSLSLEQAVGNPEIEHLILKCFAGQGFRLENDSFGIKNQTAEILWNTLNARLPEIRAEKGTDKLFSLNEIMENQRKAEAEFNMNPEIAQNKNGLHDYFNGFVDLMFVRKSQDGNSVYSIADWKTDTLEIEEYADSEVLKKHTDEHYSIQRVLYSYCLIKWLKQFYSESEQEIFSHHFGGIYYIYVKGCKAGTSNGIYAQTWKDWESLDAAFHLIVKEKIPYIPEEK